MAPSKLVAWLNVRKVRVDVPVVLQARAQRAASMTNVVNSARKKRVSCDRTFKMKMVRSGLFATKDAKCGLSRELL